MPEVNKLQTITVPGRVTIGIPTFNRSRLAVRAIGSALAQNYPDLEVIVSDNASSDDTIERINEIRNSRLVFFRQQPSLGMIANLDFCLRHATGEFFLLLGDDDVLLPGAIEKLVEPFYHPPAGVKPETIGLVWCPCCITDADGAQLWTTDAGPEVESPVSLLVAMFGGKRGPRLSSILVRTADAIAVGGYRQQHGALCDLGNWGQATLLRDHVVGLAHPLVQYTQHSGSTTSQAAMRQWQELALTVHADLCASATARGDFAGARQLKAARRNLLSSATLTVLIQMIGKPGWIRNVGREILRSPSLLFTPYVGRRLLKEGWKMLRLFH
ncbi:MAG: glycosyltransferase family 2 protein [Candidatus Competibacteraceae bacterium]